MAVSGRWRVTRRAAKGRLLVALAAVTAVSWATIASLSPSVTAATIPDDKGCAWPINYPGGANYAYPDTNAAYFVTPIILDPGDRVVITGKDPKARYWSMQTYRFSDSTLIDSVNDVTVKRKGSGTKATWSVQVVRPEADTGKDPNVLAGAGDFDGTNFGSNLTVIMMRVYLGEKTISGGPLPTLTIESAAGKRVLRPCKPAQVKPPARNPNMLPAVGVPDRFVRADGGRFYPSADAVYLVAQEAYDADRVLVITGRAPRTPQDTRYWSMCQNVNEGLLPVVACLRDNQVIVDRGGRYRIAVVSQAQVPTAARSAYKGVTFLDWGAAKADGTYSDAFLLYRNILPSPSFAGSVDRVPYGAYGVDHIGDYAPTLSTMSRAEFDAQFASPR